MKNGGQDNHILCLNNNKRKAKMHTYPSDIQLPRTLATLSK